MPISAAQPQCSAAPPLRRVVAAVGKRGGGGGGGAKRRGREKQQQQQQAAAPPRSKTLHMAECKADEILCFDPVPAARGALQVLYAYPNTYSVGITSLGYQLVIASVRTNTVTPQLAAALSSRGTRSLTVAVESGSQRVRDIVNKKLATEEIVQCARNAQEGGLEGLKLYGMVGVPGEQEEDVDATITMMQQLRREAPKLRLTLGCSTFVPKAHTPFQWYGVSSEGDRRLKRLEKALGREGVEFRPESYKWSVVQALLSRGDRRLSRLLLLVRQYGDSLGSFRRAFKELQGELPPMEHYVSSNYDPAATVLPWSHLHGPLPLATLVKHQEEAQRHM
ncbi:hypothetical protein CHLNCDRAFT_140442 [Chlorella variabilis]|uniref:Elp3/MiaA/NifB-like radical SAM core domain-containing protein n=1 Tax=Chlorella variabilis TaxID=554065 RepID=E1Z721_CHLVA|nr:hypothetical protein CHLNCDRAFT_140442 [Chlorella variabilis]EFN58743.1 hypothetical protein CHLNCDRAFT_140442 [Chlorella variabilis]|eukprot:XP_005850845.1 hypothetical protein CHLNCDRAFT_140442 [Chlorella variabilis]